jgi:hypothetical protein
MRSARGNRDGNASRGERPAELKYGRKTVIGFDGKGTNKHSMQPFRHGLIAASPAFYLDVCGAALEVTRPNSRIGLAFVRQNAAKAKVGGYGQ